jgi:hypothetical protein
MLLQMPVKKPVLAALLFLLVSRLLFCGARGERKQTAFVPQTPLSGPEFTGSLQARLVSRETPQEEAPQEEAEAPPEALPGAEAALPVSAPGPAAPFPPAASGPGQADLGGTVQGPADRAEAVMKALAAAYPGRLGPAEYRDGDWAVLLRTLENPDGVWFYYAGGRLLPEELRSRFSEYDPQPFYAYRAELPPWTPPTAEESARMREREKQRQAHPAKRSQHFYDALWRARSRSESWDRVKQIRFLGHPALVHFSILEELSLVEERILKEAKTKPRVRKWMESLKSAEGWNWRSIAATQSRSFHAYGTALDLLPKSQGGLETYWLWTARTNAEWWTVPYSKRLHPPEEVVKAFEAFGFIWGGKWLTYDTMHFEYRPEILIFSGMAPTELR